MLDAAGRRGPAPERPGTGAAERACSAGTRPILVRRASAGARLCGRDPARRYALAARGCVRHGLEERCPCDLSAAPAGRVGPRVITYFSICRRARRDDPENRAIRVLITRLGYQGLVRAPVSGRGLCRCARCERPWVARSRRNRSDLGSGLWKNPDGDSVVRADVKVDTAFHFVMTATIREKVEMTRNMGAFDRVFGPLSSRRPPSWWRSSWARAHSVGSSSSSSPGSWWSRASWGSARPTPSSGSRRTRAGCIASAIASAAVTPSPPTSASRDHGGA